VFGRDPLRLSRELIVSVLTAGFIYAGLLTHPGAAYAVPVPPEDIVRVGNLLTWQLVETRPIPPSTVQRGDRWLPAGVSKVVAKGAPGERRVLVSFVQEPSGDIHAKVISSQIIREPRPRIIANGGRYANVLAQFAEHGIQKTAFIVESEMRMVATAYTADCAGCSGVTASGRPAGRGVVAVDPRVIPLGTRLYIPGYGIAVAGDTGGAIHGARIDLGFNTWRDAMRFGRREVTIYRLK
jgi:3D (Asp-Asp-Asp) domain-containing protein